MNQIQKYYPNFCEGFDTHIGLFETIDDLIKVPFVRAFSETPTFHRFSLSGKYLVAEFKEGKEWWIVGWIKDQNSVELPKWEPKK